MRARMMIAVGALAVSLVSAGWGTASAPAAQGPNSFEGTCRLSGEFVFDQPLGNELRTTTFTDTASGTCSGILNGVTRENIPVVNNVSGSGTLSCIAGDTTTDDTLTFARWTAMSAFTPFFQLHGRANLAPWTVPDHQDETVARYILRRRLEACSRALLSPSQRGRTVTAIAFDYGFNSPTHFGRVFRAVAWRTMRGMVTANAPP